MDCKFIEFLIGVTDKKKSAPYRFALQSYGQPMDGNALEICSGLIAHL
jgi:hypothetical protein